MHLIVFKLDLGITKTIANIDLEFFQLNLIISKDNTLVIKEPGYLEKYV